MAARMETERSEARRLRRDHGMKLRAIAVRLGVAVGTVHRWTRDIELTEEQRIRNRAGPTGPRRAEHTAKLTSAWSELNRARRERAEGAKDGNSVVFANSDSSMVAYFVRFLPEAMGVSRSDITVRLNVYVTNGLSLREIEDHWLWALDVPRTSLRRHTINHRPTSSSGRKRHKLPYGVCTVRVKRSTALVQHIYGAIQEYAGFEEPRWLDGPPRRRACDLDRPRLTACSSSPTAAVNKPPSSPASGSAVGST